MEMPSSTIRELARELLTREATEQAASDRLAVEIVCEKLGTSLTRFAGHEGFRALMRRSLALSRAEVASLNAVQQRPDGCVDGFDALSQEEGDEAATTLMANFLWLLVTFVGEPHALRLVNDAWPESENGQ